MVLQEPFPLHAFVHKTTLFAPACNTDCDSPDTWVTSSSVHTRGIPEALPVRVPPSSEQTSAAVATLALACAPEQPYPMSRLPSKAGLQAVLSRLLARDVTVESIRVTAASPVRVQNIYTIDLAGGQQLVFGTAPSTMVRLLRSEQLLIESEAVLLRWMRDTLTRDKLTVDKVGVFQEPGNGNTRNGNYSGSTAESNPPLLTAPHSSVRSSQIRSALPQMELLSILPTVIASSTTDTLTVDNIIDPPYLISHQPTGQAVNADSFHRWALRDHPVDNRHIEFQAGTIVRQLSRMTAPTGQFGPAISVLGPWITDGDSSSSRTTRPATAVGNNKTWSRAFQSMMEGVLRDAEDMTIHIPYAAIRAQMRRLGLFLDVVTTPRLVLVDAGEPSNLLLWARGVLSDDAAHVCASMGLSNQGEDVGSQRSRQQPTVVGLADWSNAFFGDPLFTKAFITRPSRSFLDGFYGNVESAEGRADIGEDDLRWYHQDTSSVRILLYSCYHHAVSIVQEYYRPRQGSTGREMEARRKLGEVLVSLAAVDVGDESQGMGWQFRHGGLTATPSGLDISSQGVDWSSGQYTCRAELRG